ncbi:MFS amino acid permease [Rhizopogon vinicolor AM-OR11-026]|uniref:MFS amino acid permease n=1 Tax=Rhizopogon vinicolor AM-OR11-026 TaxID=1314800 RepID=A0A1B7N1J3_9AGAM|nr:MFS amino acid permease [Rhizopogon vinicolor AM-OR11-026]
MDLILQSWHLRGCLRVEAEKSSEVGRSNIRSSRFSGEIVWNFNTILKWPAASWRQSEEHVIPENRLSIVFPGILCATFIVVLDEAMIATALPTIVAHLGGANNYTWLGSAYLLGSSALGPLYGKWSDMLGRKIVLFASIATFLTGSALCGAAQTMTWLIVCRAVQGLGGAGVMQLAMVIMSDIVPLNDRGTYGGCLGAVFGVARYELCFTGGFYQWCFFIQLPVGSVAAVVLFIFLNLNPHQSRPLREHLAELDFIGLTFIVLGIVCLLIGFNFGQTSWSDAKTIVLVVAGCVMLIAGGINEIFTQRSQIMPPRLFKTRTTVIILVVGIFHGIIFFGGSYYLPLYYQVLGASATEAGIRMLPFEFGHTSTSIISGIVVSRTGSYRPTFWAGIPFIAALGSGCLLQLPIIAIQASMPLKNMATSMSALGFVRSLGGAIGIALSAAIISSVLPTKLAAIPNIGSFNIGSSAGSIIQVINQIHFIKDRALREAIINAFSGTFSAVWMIFVALSGFGLVLVLFLRGYSLKRKIVRGGDGKAAGDVEKAVDTPVPTEEKGIEADSSEKTSSSLAALDKAKN